MASTQGQDVVLCQLCPNPVEHHCNLCRVDLCSPCILKHLADKTNRHEIVEFINRKEGPVLPACDTHKKNRCEMYCRECCKPTCALCVTTTHKTHDIADIGEIVENKKQQIMADLKELEDNIVPKYRNFTPIVPSRECDKVMTAIQDQEDKLCKVVRDIGSKLRDEVAKQKQKIEQENKELQTLAMETEKELNEIIQNNKQTIKAYDALAILCYKSRNGKFRDGIKESGLSCPNLLLGLVKEDHIMGMFGKLKLHDIIVSDKQRTGLQIMKAPVLLKEIESCYKVRPVLWRIACEGTGKIWVSGDNATIHQINRDGSILKTISISENVTGLSLDPQQELVFTMGWANTNVWKYKSNSKVTILDLSTWLPRGLCHTVNGNLLVSMRSLDKKRSRVVRYSGFTECQVIENDKQGKALFSVGVSHVLPLSENGNGDICVADNSGKTVVVFNSSGKLRFNYNGNIMANFFKNEFVPYHIVNDKKCHLLVCGRGNNLVHIVDCNGNFIRYIEYPCIGGISVDTENNLVVGDSNTGKIRIIRYLE